MQTDKRLTATVPLIGMNEQWEERYLEDCVRMGADSVLLVAPYDNIVRSKRRVRYAMFSEEILPPVPEQRVCDLPSIELVEHWAEVFAQLAPKYRAKGIEPYFWLGHSLGHGGELSTKAKVPFQTMVGADGDEAPGCFCPLDEGLKNYLVDVVSALAKADIPLILLDDDFRVNYHMPGVDIGCFCPKHVDRFNRENGTHYTRQELADLVYEGKDDIRAKFLKMAGDSLLELAAAMEQAVHKLNPNTRLGLATAMIHYSSEGYDIRQLAKTLAGPTRPYLRVFGAPYHVKNNPMQLGYTVDTAKHLADHLSGCDIEIIGEGDTYPHTRFFTNKTALQTHLLSSRCSGVRNMLHYPFCFATSPDFETIYVDTAESLRPAMTLLDRLLPADLSATGIRPVLDFGNLNNIPISRSMTRRERVWPDEPLALKMLSQFGIPTAGKASTTQPVLLAGYNGASYTDEELNALLDRGAIVDATAAGWLVKRGFDIGLEAVTALDQVPTFEEYSGAFSGPYQGEQVWLLCPGDTPFYDLTPKSGACAEGYFIGGTDGRRHVSCVAYEKAGRKIFTFGFDFFSVRGSFQAVSNVARGEQLRNVCRWLGVEIFAESGENLYVNAYEKGSSRTVCLVQTNTDTAPEIHLYLKEKPAGKIAFYDQKGSCPVDYVWTENGLQIHHSMGPGDLLILTYSV